MSIFHTKVVMCERRAGVHDRIAQLVVKLIRNHLYNYIINLYSSKFLARISMTSKLHNEVDARVAQSLVK